MTIMSSKRRIVIEREGSDDDTQETLQNEQEVDDNNEVDTDDDGEDVEVSDDNNLEEPVQNHTDDSDSSNKDTDDDENDDDGEPKTNAGWADSIAKILKTNKPKGKKTLVLSKAKKLTDVKQKPKPVGFEIEGADGERREDVLEDEEKEEDASQSEEHVKRRKRELPSARIKPNILEKDRERTLTKIATKGVVQLFNAVRMQQKDIDHKLKEAGPLEVKRDKVLKSIDKRAFLDVLMGEKSEKINDNEDVNKKSKSKKLKTNEENPTWNVLRDDFMMDAKMKDWDKELEQEDESEVEMEADEVECD